MTSACVVELDDDEAGDDTTGDPQDTDCDDSDTGDTGDTGEEPAHECTPYEPTVFEDSLSGSWASAQDSSHETILTVPADPGGGVLELELDTGADGPTAWLEIFAEGDDVGAVAGSSAAGTEDPQTKYIDFAVAPGQGYQINLRQWDSLPAEQYPAAYELRWRYISLVDCFEPNDTREQAREIVLGLPLEAYLHAGYTSNQFPVEAYDDWYAVDLAEAGAIAAELVDAPGPTLRTEILITDAAGTQLGLDGSDAGGDAYTVTTGELEPGRYFVRVGVWAGQPMAIADQEPTPASWSTPYTLVVRSEG